ncbi:hypothetical protein [Aquibacillus sediminis]|uniref:hypothetical protein n=1 Tax=Aquibacillus sediminis TaxID=2574734 RepID=UPI00110964ED|nr:hypothetical protein [Aquibacillus sediminis]
MAGNKELENNMKDYLNEYTLEFSYQQMFNEIKFSPEISMLAQLAVHLYQGRNDFKATKLFHLNENNFNLAMNACEYGLRSYKNDEQEPVTSPSTV